MMMTKRKRNFLSYYLIYCGREGGVVTCFNWLTEWRGGGRGIK